MLFNPSEHRLVISKACVSTATNLHVVPSFFKSICDFDLWFFKNAAGVARIGSQTINLSPGVAFILYPGIDAEIRFVGESVCYWVHFECYKGRRPERDTRLFGDGDALVYHTVDSFFFEIAMRRIIAFTEDLRNRSALGMAPEEVRHETLLAHLLSDFVASSQSPVIDSRIDRRHRKIMVEALGLIRQNPKTFPDVLGIARNYGYHPDYFSHLFKEVHGQTPSRAIIAARIDQAKWLLRCSDFSIGQIAEEVGFNDLYYFSRRFKLETSLTPSEFREGESERHSR